MKSLIIQDNNNGNNQHVIDEINRLLKSGKSVFLFTYMDGCGPCNSTIPQWDNISKSDKLKDHIINHEIVKRYFQMIFLMIIVPVFLLPRHLNCTVKMFY